MTLDELTQRLPTITAGFFAIGFVLLLLSLVLFRRSRGANYWLQRRSAGQRGLRMLLLSMLFLTLSAGFCITTVLFSLLEDDSADTSAASTAIADFSSIVSPQGTIATLTPTPTPTASPTASPTTDQNTNTPTGTDTPDPTNTYTPTATLPATEETVTSANASSSGADSDENTATPTLSATATITNTDVPTETPTPTSSTTPEPTLTPTATDTDVPSATTTPSPTPSNTPTHTATPTNTSSPTLTLTPSQTPTPSSTPLPTISLNNIVVTPLADAAEDAQLEVYAIAASIDSEFDAIDPAQRFEGDVTRLYFFIEYENMRAGMLWRWELVRDDDVIDTRQRLWGAVGNGRTFFFLRPVDGFEAGRYTLQLYIGENEEPTSTIEFIVAA